MPTFHSALSHQVRGRSALEKLQRIKFHVVSKEPRPSLGSFQRYHVAMMLPILSHLVSLPNTDPSHPVDPSRVLALGQILSNFIPKVLSVRGRHVLPTLERSESEKLLILDTKTSMRITSKTSLIST